MSNSYRVTTDQREFDLQSIHQFLSSTYWSKNIPQATLFKAIEHSLCFSVLSAVNKQVGFARLVTDKATFAYLADVYILPEYRGKGLSKKLMQAITEHPELQGLRRIVLATKDAHGLYQQFGFTPLTHPSTFMEIWSPEVYQTSGA